MKRRKRKTKGSMAGFWLLEGLVVIGFAAVFFNAQSIRQAAMDSERNADVPAKNVAMETPSMTADQAVDRSAGGWQAHRPRFTTVVGDIWEQGF